MPASSPGCRSMTSRPEAAPLGPAQVHPHQHLGPVLRLGAAGARMDGDDRVLADRARPTASCESRAACTSRAYCSSAGARSARTSSPCRAQSTSTTRSSVCLRSDSASARSSSRRRRRCRVFCAVAWSFQKSGAAACVSRSVSSRDRRASSKPPPQIGGAGREFGEGANLFVKCHELTAVPLSGESARRRPRPRPATTQATTSPIAW